MFEVVVLVVDTVTDEAEEVEVVAKIEVVVTVGLRLTTVVGAGVVTVATPIIPLT